MAVAGCPAPLDDLSPGGSGGGRDPKAHAERVVASARTSFASGMRVLSRPRREAMFALYAFSRTVDDIADGDLGRDRKAALLDDWSREIGLIYAGRPRSLVGRALVEPIARHDLPREEFDLLVEGMRMDAEGPIVAPSHDMLAAYARRVAGSVGLLSLRIFGAWRGEPSRRFGLALADALQLINILRDVEEDAAVGRLYLPAEELAAAGVPPDPAAALASPGLSRCCAAVGAMARAQMQAAEREIAAHSRLRLVPALMMMGPYKGYLGLMERSGFRRLPAPRLGRGRKVWLSLRCVAAPSA